MLIWVETAQIVNPTHSAPIACIVKHLKRKEAGHHGANSQARRAFVEDEFHQIIQSFEAKNNKELASWRSAYKCFQFFMILRANDATTLCKPDLFTFQQYQEFGICTQLYGSKNVRAERDAPTQLLLGAKDVVYCVLTAREHDWKLIFFSNQKSIQG